MSGPTAVGIFCRQAARSGEKPLIHYRQGDSWHVETWTDVRRHVLAVASALIAAGVQPRHSAVLISGKRGEGGDCRVAIQTIGAGPASVYPHNPPGVGPTNARPPGA